MSMINVFIVDDHQIFLDGIVSLLTDEPNIKIIGTAHNGKQAVEKIKNQKIKTHYYISPQIWAWKENRVEIISKQASEQSILTLQMIR